MLAAQDFVKNNEAMARKWGLEESLAYTRALAISHYENFHVVSFLLPKRLHQDFYNVYSFCRWADDLGDEIGDTEESLRLLAFGGLADNDRQVVNLIGVEGMHRLREFRCDVIRHVYNVADGVQPNRLQAVLEPQG